MKDLYHLFQSEGPQAVLIRFRSKPTELLDDDQLSVVTNAIRIIEGPQASLDFARHLFDDAPSEGRALALAWSQLSARDWSGAMATIEIVREPVRNWDYACMIRSIALACLGLCQDAHSIVAEFPVTRRPTDIEFARIAVDQACNERRTVQDLLTRYDLTSEDYAFRKVFVEQALAEPDMESLRQLLELPPVPDCPIDLVARLVLARSDADWHRYRELKLRAQDMRHLVFDIYATSWLGYCLEVDGELVEAQRLYVYAKKWYAQYGPTKGLAGTIALLSRIAWKRREFRESLQLANEALGLDPENSVARRVRFRSYLGTWQIGKALASLGR